MRRRLVFGALAVVVVAVVAWWTIGAATYDDLARGSTAWAGTDAKVVTSDDVDRHEVVRKPLRAGKITQFGVSVRNAGSRTVTITGVGDQAKDYVGRTDYQLTPAGVAMSRDEYPRDQLLPFKAFKLDPGKERYLVLSVRMPACAHFGPGSELGIDNFEVRYRVLAFHHTQRLPLLDPIQVVRGKRCA